MEVTSALICLHWCEELSIIRWRAGGAPNLCCNTNHRLASFSSFLYLQKGKLCKFMQLIFNFLFLFLKQKNLFLSHFCPPENENKSDLKEGTQILSFWNILEEVAQNTFLYIIKQTKTLLSNLLFSWTRSNKRGKSLNISMITLSKNHKCSFDSNSSGFLNYNKSHSSLYYQLSCCQTKSNLYERIGIEMKSQTKLVAVPVLWVQSACKNHKKRMGITWHIWFPFFITTIPAILIQKL